MLVLGAVPPLDAQAPWVLESGPEEVGAIPLVPPELVPAWRGSYGNGDEVFWLYLTRSPHFFGAPATTRNLEGTPWTAVVLFPASWSRESQDEWFQRWKDEFLRLSTLPNLGVPVSFPAVLRKGGK